MRPEADKSTTKAKASKPTVDPIITVEGLRNAAPGTRWKTPSVTLTTSPPSAPQIERHSLAPHHRPSPDFSAPGTPASHSATPSLLSEADLIPDAMPPQALFTMDTEGMIDPGMEYIPPPNANLIARKKLRPVPPHIKREAESEDEEGCEREDDFEKPVGQGEGPPLLAGAKRLHRKLLVRQAKRQRGLPLLDIDRAVSAALSLVGGIYCAQEVGLLMGCGITGKYRTNSQELRVLDRFQVKVQTVLGHLVVKIPTSGTFLFHLMVTFWGSGLMFWTLVLDRSGTLSLYRFRRDYESRPVKLRLLAEIRSYCPQEGPKLVRPNHIPSVNAMCHDSFWPGVGPVRCLQYPDFSVVVLYKKVVIGFGFMVPDVKYNEAYISFLLVHPEWRRAGIGTFMIYHLIQTCMGKDVTLHVSASNPAMLLYQKFGFKAEEYILDFYDKYYPVDSTECRHAFFLRLRR
uniref:Lysine acetyltransferase 14 n=1 Tax=Sphaeramia orbicularis TaxID=375764 RepID=A0A673C2Q2_9TELE